MNHHWAWAPMLVDHIFEIIRSINQQEGVAVLLVEQNANEAWLMPTGLRVRGAGRVNWKGRPLNCVPTRA